MNIRIPYFLYTQDDDTIYTYLYSEGIRVAEGRTYAGTGECYVSLPAIQLHHILRCFKKEELPIVIKTLIAIQTNEPNDINILLSRYRPFNKADFERVFETLAQLNIIEYTKDRQEIEYSLNFPK